MDVDEFRQRGKEMVDWIADYMKNVSEKRVIPDPDIIQPGYLREILPNSAPMKGEAWEDIMEDVNTAILPGVSNI